MSGEAPATSLYQALLNAQRSMGKVIKNATNPHLKSKYADLGSVLDTIEQPLWDNGLLLAQRFQYDRIGRDGTAGEGTPILITELIHAASGEKIESVVAVTAKDPTDPQKIGAAITYYRRYSLLALLGLAPEDDDGHAASQPRRESSYPPQGRTLEEALNSGVGHGRVIPNPPPQFVAARPAPAPAAQVAQHQQQGQLPASDPGSQRASERQVKFIYAIAREAGLDGQELAAWSQELYAQDVDRLSRRDASTLIEALQRRRNEVA